MSRQVKKSQKKIRVYVSHSTGFDFKRYLYRPLKGMKDKRVKLLLPHERNRKPYAFLNAVKNSRIDLLLAEGSYPSTGQGIEVAYADFYKIPIVVMCKKGSIMSQSLLKLAKYNLEYARISDILPALQDLIYKYGKM